MAPEVHDTVSVKITLLSELCGMTVYKGELFGKFMDDASTKQFPQRQTKVRIAIKRTFLRVQSSYVTLLWSWSRLSAQRAVYSM
jgi:hypothetical protein